MPLAPGESHSPVEKRDSTRAAGEASVPDEFALTLLPSRHAALAPIINPSRQAPDFGLPDVQWANRDFKPGEYTERRDEVGALLKRLNSIPAILVHQFSGRTWCDTISALYQAFGESEKRFERWDDMRGTRADPMVLMQKGMFGTMTGEAYLPSKLINDYELLRTMRLEDVLFQVRAYQSLPRDQQTFLTAVENHLLVVNQSSEHRVSIQLVPRNSSDLPDHRYFSFYERLATYGVSGIFSITGANSLYDIHLGRFDRRAIAGGDSSLPLLPQNEATAPEVKTNVQAVRVTSRSSTEAGGILSGSATFDADGSEYRIQRSTGGKLSVLIDGKKTTPADANAASLLAAKILDRSVCPIHTQVELDIASLERVTDGPLSTERSNKALSAEGEKQKHSVVYKQGTKEVDDAATASYQALVENLSCGGSFNIPHFAARLKPIAKQLSEEQVDFICIALFDYFGSSLETGHIKNLEGLEEIFNVRGRPLPMRPEVADKIRLYSEMLPAGVITRVLTSIDTSGFVTPDVHKIRLQRDEDAENARDPLLNLLRTRPREHVEFFDEMGRPVDLAPHQPELMARLVAYVQENLPGIEVTPEVIRDIKRYGELIQVTQGRGADLDRLPAPLAISLCRTLEFNVGLQLPALRDRLPSAAMEEMAALPPPTGAETVLFALDFPGQTKQPALPPAEKPTIRDATTQLESLFYDLADAFEKKAYGEAKRTLATMREISESAGVPVPSAAEFTSIKLEILDGTLTKANAQERSGLPSGIVAQIREKLSKRAPEDTLQSLGFKTFKEHGYGGYMIVAAELS